MDSQHVISLHIAIDNDYSRNAKPRSKECYQTLLGYFN